MFKNNKYNFNKQMDKIKIAESFYKIFRLY